MLTHAVNQKIGSPQLSALAAGQVKIETVTYDGTKESGGLGSVIPPMVFLVIFYGLIVLLAGQMLNSTLEEKENRVTEMILTTLKPTTLISGQGHRAVRDRTGPDARVRLPHRHRLAVLPRRAQHPRPGPRRPDLRTRCG